MKKLKIDLELLIQSLSFDDEELAREYLDTHTGDIINIPNGLQQVVNGNQEETTLSDWQKELLEVAYSIKEDKEQRYVLIPNIEESYFYNAMIDFTNEKIASEGLKETLLKALQGTNPMRSFKNIIFENQEEEEKWYIYEEKKFEEYAIQWLKNLEIELQDS